MRLGVVLAVLVFLIGIGLRGRDVGQSDECDQPMNGAQTPLGCLCKRCED